MRDFIIIFPNVDKDFLGLKSFAIMFSIIKNIFSFVKKIPFSEEQTVEEIIMTLRMSDSTTKIFVADRSVFPFFYIYKDDFEAMIKNRFLERVG